MKLPISVIIPTMNRPESLDRTLNSMASATDIPQQIIVVDQSQDKETRLRNEEVLNNYINIESKVYVYQQTPSLTKARNNGYTEASNEIIVFSDDDVDVPADIFTNVARLMQNEDVAMIAGIDEFTKQSKTNIGYFLGTKSYFNRKIGHVTLSMLGRYPDNISTQVETQWAQGYFFVVRKSCLDCWKIRWDENLTSYAYAEDLDFSYAYYKAAKKNGYRCIIDPSVRVKHLATLEYRVPSAKSVYMYVINRFYLLYKHQMGLMGIFAYNWCNSWRLVQRIVKRDNALAFVHAWWCTIKYQQEIRQGRLIYDRFMAK